MNLKEMIARLNAAATKISEFHKLDQEGKLTAEQSTEFDQVLAEFNDLAPKVEEGQKRERTANQAATMLQSAGRVSGIVAGTAGENRGRGGAEIDLRSIGQRFAESEELADWLKNGGKSSAKFGVGGLLNPNPRKVRYTKEDQEAGAQLRRQGREDYALITTEDTPAYMVPPMVIPGIARGRDYALTLRDVLINGTTTADTIYFLRELLFTNNAAETAQATTFDETALGTSGKKPQSSLTFEQDSAPVVTIAHWIPITRQALADAAQLQTYVESRLLVGLARRLNSQIANGAGGGTNMTGIFNTSGIQTLDDAYFGANPVENPDSRTENFERIARAQSLIETVADGEATFVALNPRDIERLMTTVDANGQYYGGGPFMAAGVRTIWGLPIARERAITIGTALVGDGTAAIVWDREEANILIDTINDQFIRNMLTILAELRAALTVIRPSAFAEVELVPAA